MTKNKVTPKKSRISKTEKTDNGFKTVEISYMGWILAALYFVILSIISFAYHKIGDYGIETDFFWSYVPQAESFMNGEIIIDKYRPPLYPIVLGLINFIVGNYFASGMWIAIISASLVVFFSYSLLRSLFNPLIALITTILLGLNTTFHLYTYSAGTDMFFNFLVTASLYFLLACKNFKWKNLLLAALFSGLAYITRYNGVFMLVSSLVIILLINVYKMEWGKRFVAIVLYTAVFVAVITPWGIHTYKVKGKTFWNQNYQNIAYEYLAKDKMGWDEFWYQGNRDKYNSLTEVIMLEPSAFFKKFVSNGFDHLGKDMNSLIGWHIALFSLIGLLLFFTRPPDRRQWSFYLANVMFFGVLLLVFYNERFSLFLIPFYTVIGVSALFLSNKYLKEKLVHSRFWILAIACILSVWTFSRSYSYNSENINSGDKNLLKLQEEFYKVEHPSVKGKKMMARKAHVPYYLGLEMTWVPFVQNYYEQVAHLWKAEVDYVSYGIWEMGRGMDYLREPDKLPPDFKLIVYTSARNKVVSPDPEKKSPYKIEVNKQDQPALVFKVVKDSLVLAIIDAGNWLNENRANETDINIMAALPYIAFYTGSDFVEMPVLDVNDLLAYMSERNVRYLFIGLHELSRNRDLSDLLTVKRNELKLLLGRTENTSYPFVLFEKP